MNQGQEAWKCDLCPFAIKMRWWITRDPFRMNEAAKKHIKAHHRMELPEYERLAAEARKASL